MICRHCNKEFSDDFEYCPYCAEPVKKKEFEFTKLKHLTREERAKRSYKNITIVGAVLLFLSMFFVGQFLGWEIYPETLGNDAFCDEADTFAIIFWLTTIVVWVLARWVYWMITREKLMAKRVKKQIIMDQFVVDMTSICPHCGSHNIKHYRKGYNYKVGFWGAIFGVRGAGYAGGFNANHTCCRCIDCGKDWETDYDYRLINK